MRVGDEVLISAAEGNGPVNALDVALRKDLGKYQDLIQDLELVDYKVRIYQGGSDAVTRVLIEFGDASGERWSTIGVSPNIIDASFQALTDSITYKLLQSGARRCNVERPEGSSEPLLDQLRRRREARVRRAGAFEHRDHLLDPLGDEIVELEPGG